MQSIIKPNLAINAMNLSKALQLVTRDTQIREEYSDSNDDRLFNSACRAKSIVKFYEVTKTMTDTRSMGMGRPMSAGVWNIKIPNAAQQHFSPRRASATKRQQVSSMTSSTRKTSDVHSKPSLFKAMSERNLHSARSPVKSSDISSLLMVKSMTLNPPVLQSKVVRQKMLSSMSKQRIRILRTADTRRQTDNPLPYFNAVFTKPNTQEFKSQGGLTLQFKSEPPKTHSIDAAPPSSAS